MLNALYTVSHLYGIWMLAVFPNMMAESKK